MVAIAPNTALVACHRRAEQQARQSRLGVWRKLTPRSTRTVRQGGFALLQGMVERVEHNRGGYWLEMEGPLVVHIPPQAFSCLRPDSVTQACWQDARTQRLAGRSSRTDWGRAGSLDIAGDPSRNARLVTLTGQSVLYPKSRMGLGLTACSARWLVSALVLGVCSTACLSQ